MIVTRTPFRISFAGGGSDLASFWREEPGMVLSTAINKYVYLTVKERFGNSFRVSYSQTEIRDTAQEIDHPLVRTSLSLLKIDRGMEIVSIADLPAQSGLGSSSSFTVGLLSALHAYKGHFVTPAQLAAEACEIEINQLAEPIGKQDQYIAAFGGLQFFQFQPDGTVFADPVICPFDTKRELSRRLVLFFTGKTRHASSVLGNQNARASLNRETLRELCSIARRMRAEITSGNDLNQFGHLLHEAWGLKKNLESSISDSQIDQWYQAGRDAGAIGGKLLGAGGGGFLLFYCEPHCQPRLKVALKDLVEVPFDLEPQGSKVIYVGEDHW